MRVVSPFIFLFGVFLAFSFYQIETGKGIQFFSWTSSTPYSPAVAVAIGVGSGVLLLAWIVQVNTASKRIVSLLTLTSLLWSGFGFGLLGPLALGNQAEWQQPERLGNVGVVYSLQSEYVDIAYQFENIASTAGIYIDNFRDDLLLVVNRDGTLEIDGSSEIVPNETSLHVGKLVHGSVEIVRSIDLTHINPRIQHIRDIEVAQDNRVFVSNVETLEGCVIWQLWELVGVELSNEIPRTEILWETKPCLRPVDAPRGRTNVGQSGGRIESIDTNLVWMTVGDFGLGLSTPGDYDKRPDPLGPRGYYGKVWELNLNSGEATVVTSGHRNPQGLFFDARTGEAFLTEHGPQGGGELNLLVRGEDYGWPDVTVGTPYLSEKLPFGDWEVGRWAGDHVEAAAPLLAWMPSIAPSQIIRYQGQLFEAWNGDLIVATLKTESLRRIRLNEKGYVLFDQRIEVGERIRDMIMLSDGSLLLAFDSGRLGRISLP